MGIFFAVNHSAYLNFEPRLNQFNPRKVYRSLTMQQELL